VTTVVFSVEPSTSDDRCKVAVDANPERDHTAVLAEVHPVDHQRHQVQGAEIGSEQLGQGGLGLRDEPALHRRARGGGRRLVGPRPDRLE
jgi:hypothetical protein